MARNQKEQTEQPEFVIELESIKYGLLSLLPRPGVVGTLDFLPGRPDKPSRIAVTPQQFRDFNQQIEQYADPKGGNHDKFLRLWAVNVETKERQEISYADACKVLDVMSHSAALALQKEASERQEAERRKRMAERGMSSDGLTGAAQVASERGMI